jgi:hypothetical protein
LASFASGLLVDVGGADGIIVNDPVNPLIKYSKPSPHVRASSVGIR